MAGYREDSEILRKLAENNTNVTFLSSPASPEVFLSNVDVMVIPSRFEAYGLVAQEARAGGRPIIVSNVDGLVEQVDSTWGIMIEPDNVKVLVKAIKKMADMDIEIMGLAARESARYSWNAI